jgi:hypothetical protein
LTLSAGSLAAQQADLTFTRDIAPILQAKCENCHRPGTAAPMALRTYDEVRPWAPLIKDRVAKRMMPPWPLDKTIGIQDFKNDLSLSDEQIQTIIAWVDAGAPQGNLADMPAPRQWPDPNSWAYEQVFGRPPDLVVSSTPYTVVANGKDQWPTPDTLIDNLDQERWIRAIELRPANPQSRYVYHHANPSLVDPNAPAGDDAGGERDQLTDSAVGSEGFIFPEDSGRLIKPGQKIRWGMHYYPINEDVEASLVIGLWFHPLDKPPANITEGEVQFRISQTTQDGNFKEDLGQLSTNPQLNTAWPDLLIPPNSLMTIRGIHKLDKSARIHSLRGHMHFRGKYQVIEAVYPDGRWEVLNKMDWDHAWHTAFLYEDWAMPLLPKGTILLMTSVYDNTSNNRYNPDPNQWVGPGDRSVDEMSHLRFGITYFEDDAFAKLVAEREQLLAERERQRQQQAADSDADR